MSTGMQDAIQTTMGKSLNPQQYQAFEAGRTRSKSAPLVFLYGPLWLAKTIRQGRLPYFP